MKMYSAFIALIFSVLTIGHIQAQSPSAVKANEKAKDVSPGKPDNAPQPGDVNTGSSTGYHNRDENPEAAKSVDFADTVKQEAIKDKKRRK